MWHKLLASTNILTIPDEAISLRYVQYGLYRGLGKPLFGVHQIPKLVCSPSFGRDRH